MPCGVLVGSSCQLVGVGVGVRVGVGVGVGVGSGCQLSPNPALRAVPSANSKCGVWVDMKAGVGVGVGVGSTVGVQVVLGSLLSVCECVGSQAVTILEGVHWCGWLSAAVGILEVAKRQ